MARAGLPTPRNMLIEKPEQVEQAGLHVGFPAGGAELNRVMLTSKSILVQPWSDASTAVRSRQIQPAKEVSSGPGAVACLCFI